jgi:hypothetical protein
MSEGAGPALDDATELAVGIDAAWEALVATLDRSLVRKAPSEQLARTRLTPAPADAPRFQVAAVSPPVELVLEGRDRKGTYALVFRLDEVDPGRTVVWAESRGNGPGAADAVQRLLILVSGGQVSGIRGLLRSVRKRAEGTR